MHIILHIIESRLHAIRVPLLLIILITAVMAFSSCGVDLAASAGNISSDTSVESQAEEETEFSDSIEEDYDDESLWDEDDEDIEDSEELTEESQDEEESTITYVLNTNTQKFHYPDCRSVKQMKDKNKLVEETTREDLINRGYSPCGNCNP